MKFKMPQKPKISRRTITALIFVLTTGLLLLLTAVSAFSIQRVGQFKVIGETRYSDELLIESSGVALGEGLFFRDYSDAEEKILKSATRLKSVKISPAFFSTLVIEVEEEVGTYYSYINGDYYLLSDGLRVLEMSKSPEAYSSEAKKLSIYSNDISTAIEGEYLEFTDEKVNDEIKKFIDEMNSIPLGEHGITSLGFEDTLWRDAYVVLDGRIKIIFGDTEGASDKIGFALRFIYESKITYEYSKIIIMEGKNGYEAYYSEVEAVE